MIIVPMDRQVDWRRPPVVTLLLVALNVALYLLFQADDGEQLAAARAYYFDSGLYEVELPRYQRYVSTHGSREQTTEWEGLLLSRDAPWWFFMEMDARFMAALGADRIITPDDADYPEWKRRRAQMDAMLDDVATWKYALRPGRPTAVTTVTHLFVHGSLLHLIGNMLFLFALGFIVETCLGTAVFSACYFIAGIGAALFTLPFTLGTASLDVGASGAIAGLMGMYAVLFGLRKIRFFYFVYVYFDYVRLPAIALLPLWLAYEIAQQLLAAGESGINYLAHIGGLSSGAALAFAIKASRLFAIDTAYLDERADRERITSGLALAERHIRALEYRQAIAVLEHLLHRHPANRHVLARLYQCARLEPRSPAHRNAALRIFQLTDPHERTSALVRKTFADYVGARDPAPLPGVTVRALADRFLRDGALQEVQVLVAMMIRRPDDREELPFYVLGLVDRLVKASARAQAEPLVRFLQREFPERQETAVAAELLDS